MADVQQIKSTLLLAAYQAAVAALENASPVDATGKPLPVIADSTVQDPGLRAKNLAIYEVAKVHYTALVNAFQDQTGVWPDPKVPTPVPAKPVVPANVPAPGADIAGTVASVAKALTPTVGPVAGVVGAVANALANPQASSPVQTPN